MEQEAIAPLIQAVRDHAWYAVFGYAITLLIAVWRVWKPVLWERIPYRLQWLPALVLTGLTAFLTAWQTGLEPVHAVAVAAWAVAVGGPAAIGGAHTGKRLLGMGGDGGELNALKGAGRVGLVVLVFGGSLLLLGCSGTLTEAHSAGIADKYDKDFREVGYAPSSRCSQLDGRRSTWGAVAAGAAVLSGVSGISTLPVPDDQREAQIGLASGALAMAALAAVAVAVEQSADASWVRECSVH